MNTEFNDDDVTQYLPVLRRETPVKDQILEDFEGESSWYESFMSEVKDDIDPRKLHELVVDYLICSGYREVAQVLCEDAQLKFPKSADESPNADTLEKRCEIRNSIMGGELERALVQIEELAPNLLKDDSKLHFKLLRQQLVELIRNKDIDKVLSFAQEHIMDKCDQPPELFTKLEQTFALLAFDRPEQSPFGYLMSMNQRNVLANEVNSSVLAHLKRNPTSKLENLLRVIVFNHNQVATKGEAPSSTHQFNQETAVRLSRELFGVGDELCDSPL